MSAKLQAVSVKVSEFADKAVAAGEKVSRMGSAMIPVSAALAAGAGAAFKFGSDFDATMTRVAVLTDIGIGGVGKMSAAVQAMSGTVATGPQALADGLMVVASTGLTGAKALDVLKASAIASAVGLGDTKDVSRAVTAAIKAYGDANMTAEQATNKLFIAVRAGGAEASSFAGTLGNVVGVASQMGVSFDEVLASIATFTRLGVSAETATTGLRATIMSLLSPGAAAREQFVTLGTSIEEVRKRIKEQGLAAALEDLLERTHGNIDALGEIIPETRALASVLGSVGTQADATSDILHQLRTETGALDKAMVVVGQTIDFKWRQAMADAQNAAIRLFGAFREQFVGLVEWAGRGTSALAGVIEQLNTMSPVAKTAGAAIVGIGILAAPALLALGTAIKVIGFSLSGLGTIGTTAGVAMHALGNTIPVLTARLWLMEAAAKVSWAALGGPIGWIVGGIVALAAAWGAYVGDWTRSFDVLIPPLGMFRAGWDKIKDAVGPVWDVLKDVATLVGQQVSSAFHTLESAVGAAALVVRSLGSAFDGLPGSIGPSRASIVEFGEALVRHLPWLRDLVTLLALVPVVAKGMDVLANANKNAVASYEDLNNFALRQSLLGIADDTQRASAEMFELAKANIGGNAALGIIAGSGLPAAARATVTLTDEQKKLNEEFAKLRDKALGGEMIKKWEEFSRVLASVGGPSKVTSDGLEEIATSAGAVLVAAQQLGSNAGPALKKAATDAAAVLPEIMGTLDRRIMSDKPFDFGKWLMDPARVAADVEAQIAKTAPIVFDSLSQAMVRQDASWVFNDMITNGLVRAEMALTQAGGPVGSFVQELLDSLESSFESAPGKWDVIFGKLKSGLAATLQTLGTVFQGINSQVGQIFQTLGHTAQVFHDAVGTQSQKTAQKMVAAFTAAASIISGLFGGSSSPWAAMAVGAASGAAAGAALGAIWGSAAPGIGAAIGGVVGAISGWVIATKKAIEANAAATVEIQRLQGELVKTYGSFENITTISHAMGIGLAEAWGDQSQAGLIHFKGLMQEFADKMATLQGALETYGLSWRDLGEDFKQMTVNTGAGKLLDQLAAMTSAGVDWNKAVKAMGPAFSQLIIDAVDSGQKIPPALQPILGKLIEMGGLTDAAARKMLGLAEDTMPSLADITEAANRYGLELDDLGSKVQQLRITETANQIIKDFNMLTLAGVPFAVLMRDIPVSVTDAAGKVSTSLTGMRVEIQKLVGRAIALGLELPASMRPIIEKMIEAGLLTDDTGTKLTDLSKLTFAADLTKMFEALILKLDELIGKITGGVVDALTGIGNTRIPPVRIPYYYDPSDPNMPNREPQTHLGVGGIVTRPTMALIGEAGPEAVIPLSRLGAGRPQAGGGSIIQIVVQAFDPDGLDLWLRRGGAQKLAEAITPKLPGEVKLLTGTG